MSRRRGGRSRAALMALACAMSAAARGDDLFGDWTVTGSNTAQAEYHWLRGDPSGSSYQIPGRQFFDLFDLNFVRKPSGFDTWTVQISGSLNDSEYRDKDRGFLPTTLSFTRQNGDSALPYRMAAGDFGGSFSALTLDRRLKGALLEVQPPMPGPVHQSFVVLSGVDESSWRHVHATRNWTSGASWLVELDPLQHFGAHVVHNRREGDPQFGTEERKQTVAGVSADYGWAWKRQKLKLEGELAAFRGDHDGAADATGAIAPGSGRDRRGQGVFAKLTGNHETNLYDYLLGFERYDRDFRPAAGQISGDHRTEQAAFGWQFASGKTARLKAQQDVDALQSGNEKKTNTFGLTLGGLVLRGLGGTVEVSRTDVKKRDATIDVSTWTAETRLTASLRDGWTGHVNASWQQVEDRVPGASDSRTSSLHLDASHDIAVGTWRGSFAPGIDAKLVRGGSGAGSDLSPAITLTLARDRHWFEVGYGYEKIRPDDASLATVDANTFHLNYRYTRGRDSITLETLAYDRRVTVGQFNQTYRVALSWTHQLGAAPQVAQRRLLALAPAAAGPLPRDIGVVLAIAPGMELGAVRSRLEDAGYRGALALGNTLVFETRVLADVDGRQRLAIVHEFGRVMRTGLVIDISDPTNAAAVSQAYERARKALIDRFGSPTLVLEEGNFGPGLPVELNAGRFVRVMEWPTSAGTLRLGIPRRVDGRVRVEIQHAIGLTPPRDGSWSLDAVR